MAYDLQVGTRIPDVPVRVLRDGHWHESGSAALFAGRRAVAFALPGAFTPTCSSLHLPRYDELVPAFRSAGIEAIYCISVNDPYVMQAWAASQAIEDVEMVSDGNGALTRALGMIADKADLGFGPRSWRYAMVVDDGVIQQAFVEPQRPGDPFEVSDADHVLQAIAPQVAPPPQVAVISKPGCPHCARAMRMLDDAQLRFVEVPLGDAIRSRVLGAVSGEHTAPQVFIDGRRIGGADALEKVLYGEGGWPEQRTAS
jgi:glutaredoxin-like protein